jgi:HK97 family phage major capsid protein
MPSQHFTQQLHAARARAFAECERILTTAKAAGRSTLSELEQRSFDGHRADLLGLDRRIAEESEDLGRASTIPDALSSKLTRSVNSAGRIASLSFDEEELRNLHQSVLAQNPGRIQTRAFGSASSLLPPELYPQPTFPIHENRLMDRLPGYATDAPSLEVIQVNSVTGAAAIVAEGAVKPEIVMNTTKITVTVQKLAAHTGLSWESILDWDNFSSYVRGELTRQVTDLETHELVYGDGTTGHLTGLLGTSGILVHPVTGTPVTHFDDIEQSIATLRTGPSLAEPDLFITNPETWSAIRREKNLQGAYYAQTDPTSDEPETAWGVDVLVSTAINAGDGILIDTTKFGRVAVRETLGLRIGYSNDDFTRNIVRTVAEERLALCVERPSAVLHLTGLPTS